MGAAPSLRRRLLLATAAGLLLALLLAGWVLSGLFAQHVQKQFERQLLGQLDNVTARLVFNDQGLPHIDPRTLSDPRWQKPYSGLYWQIDALKGPHNPDRSVALRSRSLWDAALALNNDTMADGQWHVHHTPGPQGQNLLVVERALRSDDTPGIQWRVVVAEDSADNTAATQAYTQVLGLSLAVLFAALMLVAWAQVAVGLRPLDTLRAGLQRLRQGETARLEGTFPTEVQPLVADLNQVLLQNDTLVERARTQAGNLAHALRTPLAVIRQVANQTGDTSAAWPTVLEQVATAQHHIDWHLKRAQRASLAGVRGLKTEVAPLLSGLVRVMKKVHAEKRLTVLVQTPPETTWFAGDPQDFQEMVGNLLDNACKWAHHEVHLRVQNTPDHGLIVSVEDDGPGVDPAALSTMTQRGVRLDEKTPGSGLGLAIVQDVAEVYGGKLVLTSPCALGGLCATLGLPGAPTPVAAG